MKHQITKEVLLALAVGILSIFLLIPAKAQVALVANGKSTFTIVIPNNAPTSVRDAARELQKDIEIATGAKLSLQKDNEKVSMPIISVGNTQQAKIAGISSRDIGDDTYCIVTKNGNVYILGIDTPDGEWTKDSGVSNGTANGVYTFLEDYLSVRWLMPGELGLDIPSKSTFTIGNINRTETPVFNYRRVEYLDDYADAQQRNAIATWMVHQRVGNSAAPVSFSATHNWLKTINSSDGGKSSHDVNTAAMKKLYTEHPEWFAMDASGARPFPKNKYAKMETTNPEFVKWYAEQAIKNLQAQKHPYPYSLSPSDGSGWSQSPESKALYDPSPPDVSDPETPSGKPGTSSLILKWYHDVAQIVAKEYPQGKLSGFIYSSFLYPPTKFNMKLPDNFTPQIAFSPSYGYGLYRPATQKLLKNVMSEWAKVAPQNWYYYDIPNLIIRQDHNKLGGTRIPGAAANIEPAAPEILDVIFPTLIENRVKGALLYGSPAWSSSALTNYLLAKLEWNPRLKAADVEQEWLRRAYGPDAGKAMEQFYAELDGWFRDFYQHSNARYELTDDILKNLYAAHYPEMEKFFLQAKAQKMTEKQQQRLQLIEDNLVVLQWRLRNAGFLPADFHSPLQRSDAQISDLVTKENAGFPLFPGVINSNVEPPAKPKPLPWKVLFSGSASADKSTFPEWNDGEFLIYAAQDGDIRITAQMVTNDVYFASYEIRNQKGELVASGIFNTAMPIVIPAKAGQSYMLTIPERKPVNFQLLVQNAVVAKGNFQDKTLTLSGKPAPVYVFYVPGNAPIGAIDDANGVRIRKPYSASVAQVYIGKNYQEAQSYPLDDGWLFSPDPNNDGLERGVTKNDFDDKSWASISPLNWWQMQGHDYHGAAWYRVKFQGKTLEKGETAYLYFGAIDGNAVVYLNGKKVGDHLLGPHFDGWDKAFARNITNRIQPGENTLAVQVTSKDNTGASGIFRGVVLITGVRNNT
jgi:hypothetical protein